MAMASKFLGTRDLGETMFSKKNTLEAGKKVLRYSQMKIEHCQIPDISDEMDDYLLFGDDTA